MCQAADLGDVDSREARAGAQAARGEALEDMLRRNWLEETRAAAFFRAMEERARNPQRRAVLRRLAEAEARHAGLWAQRLEDLGAPVPDQAREEPSVPPPYGRREQAAAMQYAEERERQAVSRYTRQLREVRDEETAQALREIILEEFAQAQSLRRLNTRSDPRAALDLLLRRERRSTGSWIGDAIYGVNDGLGAIFGIVSGVSGATLGNSRFVLLAGVAGMIASALSMGAGAYLASKSERELYEAELHRERVALESSPEEAKEEMAVFYQLKGVPEADARKIADYLAASPEQFLRALAAEKLNLTEDALSVPFISAVSSALSTAVGAFIPIVPFFFLNGYPAVMTAALVSLAAHFAVGAAKSLVTVRAWWSSGLEMTLVGAVEGIVTYLAGVGLGRVGG